MVFPFFGAKYIENLLTLVSMVDGKENDGFRVVMETLDAGRIGIAAQAVGIAQGALDEAISYIKQRRQFGKAISDFEGIQFMLAEMGTELEASRLLTYHAAKNGKTMNHV